MSYYIKSTPSKNGNYGNPQSNKREDTYELPDALLSDYLDSMGFVTLTVNDGVIAAVARNEEAYQAYQKEHPAPEPPGAADERENAYNTEKIIDWNGEKITVTAAAQQWQYYAAEGSEKADELQALIAKAKAEIRNRYPD